MESKMALNLDVTSQSVNDRQQIEIFLVSFHEFVPPVKQLFTA